MPAARDNIGKPMLSFILQFPTSIAAFARVKELGAIKYERDNWKKAGKPDVEYLDAALRHITSFMEGETFASDTGCTHLAHAMWNIMALQDLNYKDITHDLDLFELMCEYWKSRRFAESYGATNFPTVEEWMAHRKVCAEEENIAPVGECNDQVNIERPQTANNSDAATREAASRLLEKVLDKPKKFEFQTVELRAPVLSKDHYFDSPLTCVEGQSIANAAEELSRVAGTSIESAEIAIMDAHNAFSSEAVDCIVGKTDRSVDELREEARRNIARHTSLSGVENAELDALIAHPSHKRFIKQKQDEAWLKGYAEAQQELREEYNPALDRCDDPECSCNQ